MVSIMSSPTSLSIKFWGTRGSIPCPGPDTVKYGGNTTCFEIFCGSKRVIIDAGTGIRLLGKKIMIEEKNLSMLICFLLILTWIISRAFLFLLLFIMRTAMYVCTQVTLPEISMIYMVSSEQC